jgi:hypothetical protein
MIEVGPPNRFDTVCDACSHLSELHTLIERLEAEGGEQELRMLSIALNRLSVRAMPRAWPALGRLAR